jgi:hypothetical protein
MEPDEMLVVTAGPIYAALLADNEHPLAKDARQSLMRQAVQEARMIWEIVQAPQSA